MNTLRFCWFLASTAFCTGWILQASIAPTSAGIGPHSRGFEENQGQAPANVRFIQRAAGYTVLALDHGLELQLKASGEHPPSLHMDFAGTGPTLRVSAQELLPGRVNYLKGNNPAAWHRDISTFARVQYDDLYPGVTASFYSSGGQLEYDVALQPQADLSIVKLRFSSAGAAMQPTLTSEGDLLLRSDAGELRLHKPVVYQLSKTRAKQFLQGQFMLRSPNEVGFSVPAYDHTKPLIVDPVVTYSSYFGGNSYDTISGIKLDAEGNVYIAGETGSRDFPNKSAVQSTFGGNVDAFVSKFDPTGTKLAYSTYLGGSSTDRCNELAVALDGSVSLIGTTSSNDFPLVNPVLSVPKNGDEVFVARLDSSGSRLIFSTYLGGGFGRGIALGPDESIYVTGGAVWSDFVATKGVIRSSCIADFGPKSCGDAFVTRFSPDGQLIYSTFLGGTGSEFGTGIAVDSQGQAYIAGITTSNDFPLERAAQRENKSVSSAFLSRISPDGTQLILSTYFGGSGQLTTTGMALDRWHNVYLTGYIFLLEGPTGLPLPDAGLPLLHAFQVYPGGGMVDGFIVKFNPKGQPIYSSYLGGSSDDLPSEVAVDAEGQAVVLGYTTSTDFPTFDPLQGSMNGGSDVFVTKIAASGSSLIYSTYLGGSGLEYGSSVTNDGAGGVWVAGDTTSTDFPLLNPFQPVFASGYSDGFLTHIAPSAKDPAAVTCTACKSQ